jgi:hypothetical protein
MFKIILYSIIIITIIHFVLYYFNFDITQMNIFNLFNILNSKNSSNKLIESDIYDSINELKTLNECINNGQIDTSIS